jgi:transcriptional regulator with XRE-family HTH domain
VTSDLSETRALRRLRQWVSEDRDDRTGERLAAALEVAQPTVSRWLAGRSRPDHHMRLALANLTGGAVAVEDWLTREEAKLVGRVKPLRPSTVG